MAKPSTHKDNKLDRKTIWVLTEERPKTAIIKSIMHILNKKYKIGSPTDINNTKLKIRPNTFDNKFNFEYNLEGMNIDVTIKIIEGCQGSFVDYLVFVSENPPRYDDVPELVIEETKTTQTESRNTSVYQRLTKFVFLAQFTNYSHCRKIMLYNTNKPLTKAPSSTFVFGVKLMKTLDIEIVGIDVSDSKFEPFTNIDELINHKNTIKTRKRNVSVKIERIHDTINISAKLEKSGKLCHDPNIGLVTALSMAIQKLDVTIAQINITNHGLTQDMIIGTKNKFTKIATALGIRCDKLKLTPAPIDTRKPYWKYTDHNEKIVSILLHTILEYNDFKVIYNHHSGGEQGYVIDRNDSAQTVDKKTKKPDIAFLSEIEHAVYVVEAELDANVFKKGSGMSQLENLGTFKKLILDLYPNYTIKPRVICYGNNLDPKKLNASIDILFQLKPDGKIIASHHCPLWLSDLFSIVQKTTTLQDYVVRERHVSGS